jgi:hypothetical protein
MHLVCDPPDIPLQLVRLQCDALGGPTGRIAYGSGCAADLGEASASLESRARTSSHEAMKRKVNLGGEMWRQEEAGEVTR